MEPPRIRAPTSRVPPPARRTPRRAGPELSAAAWRVLRTPAKQPGLSGCHGRSLRVTKWNRRAKLLGTGMEGPSARCCIALRS